jgi:hypothetical protein
MCINLHFLLPLLGFVNPIRYKKFSGFSVRVMKTMALQGFLLQRELALLVLSMWVEVKDLWNIEENSSPA